MRKGEYNGGLLGIILTLAFLLFIMSLLFATLVHSDPIPTKNPQTQEDGYWISEGDLEATIVAVETVKELEKIVQQQRKREAILYGTTTGVVIAVITYLLLQLFGGSGG